MTDTPAQPASPQEPETPSPTNLSDPGAVTPRGPDGGAEEPEAPAPPEPGDELARTRAEAANRRRQLREVEGERDQLRARVDQHDRAQVEQLAAGQLVDASDIWIIASLEELRDEDGAVDAEKVRAQVADALEKKPHWSKPSEAPNAADHFYPGARASAPEPPSFGSSLKRQIGRKG